MAKHPKMQMPDDFADKAFRLYSEDCVDFCEERNRLGYAVKLSVPFYMGNDDFFGYEISRHGRRVTVNEIWKISSYKSKEWYSGQIDYPLTPEERRNLLELFRHIDEWKPKPVHGPHELQIIT